MTDVMEQTTAQEAADAAELRSSARVAERERARLALASGKGRAAAAVVAVSEKLRFLGSAEAATKGLRYQPVFWSVVAIIVLAAVIPDRGGSGDPDTIASGPQVSFDATPTTTAPVASEPVEVTTPTTQFVAPPTTAFQPPAPAPAPAPTPTTAPAFTPPPTAPPTTAAPRPTPLTIRDAGWATSLAGTPFGSDGVPDGTLPVGNRIGGLDKASFIRLSGTEITLRLTENSDGANESIGTARVRACAITTPGWTPQEGQSFDDAPEWDEQNCVDGTEADDRWTFDLSRFGDRSGAAGFALLPGSGAPSDFQITFRRS